MNKSFSIIIPFYKGEIFYPFLIDSIKKAILFCNEDLISFEIITIIDSIESSFDTINQIVNDCFCKIKNVNIVTIKNEKNIGVAGSRNTAISISKGDYLHFIDQDDNILEMFYKELIPLLDNYNFVLYNGMVYYTNKKYNEHKLYYIKPSISVIGLLKNDFIRSPGQVVLSKKLLKNNFFPEPINYKGADDRFFWLRILIENEDNIKSIYNSNAYYIANIHNSNYSTDKINLKKSTLENWNMFINEVDTSKYNKYIENDILRIKYALNEKMTFYYNFKGMFLNLMYFIEFNKVLRFIIKRKIFQK